MSKDLLELVMDRTGAPREEAKRLLNRAYGRSTGIALELIGLALQNPNTRFNVRDHNPNLRADDYLCEMVLDIIKRLDLIGFKVNRKAHYLIYDKVEVQEKNFGL